MKFSPKYRTKKLGMIHTIWGSFRSLLNWEGVVILPEIRPWKIPAQIEYNGLTKVFTMEFYKGI